uniref:Putative sigma-70 region domain containing protein n=1 Tax=viral metagenome TaxID=1070528 RepID=A0A6M3KKR3_9ZZZZ
MKYDGLRKTKRDARIRKYAAKHPELSQKEIAAHYQVSQSRISRILRGAI